MAYSQELAERIRELIIERLDVTGRKMFGGIAWVLSGNMAVGVNNDRMVVRLAHEEVGTALAEPHVGPMDFTGKPKRGFVTVEPKGLEDEGDLAGWIATGAGFAASLPAK